MDFTYEKFFKILKDNLLLILAGGFLCFGIAFAYSKFCVPPEYYSDAQIIIKTDKQEENNTTGSLNFERTIVNTYLAILDSNDFYENVYNSLPEEVKSNYTVNKIRNQATLTTVDRTEVIKICFTSTNKEDVKLVTTKIIENISTNFALTEKYGTNVLITESANEAEISVDSTRVYSAVGFILGMAIVFIIAVLREMLDTRVKTTKDIRERYDLPVLGAIPSFKGKKM